MSAPYKFFLSSIAAAQIISPCLAWVCLIRQRHGEPYVSPFSTLEPQTKHVFGKDLGFDGDGCTALPVSSWIKSRRHRGRRLQTYLSNRDLIHACTESHCGIRDFRPPPHPVSPPFSLLLLPCRLHSLRNHVLSPSDEKLISIHSYQRQASSHWWHRWDCCVCSLCFWGHALERRGERESDVPRLVGKGAGLFRRVSWVALFFNFMQFCLSDSTDRGSIGSIFYWRHCQQGRFMLSETVSWFHRIECVYLAVWYRVRSQCNRF